MDNCSMPNIRKTLLIAIPLALAVNALLFFSAVLIFRSDFNPNYWSGFGMATGFIVFRIVYASLTTSDDE